MFATTTTSALVASVGAVSSPIFDAIAPYVYVVVGIGLAFYFGKKIIGLFGTHRAK
jgi:hypothetical protein